MTVVRYQRAYTVKLLGYENRNCRTGSKVSDEIRRSLRSMEPNRVGSLKTGSIGQWDWIYHGYLSKALRALSLYQTSLSEAATIAGKLIVVG